MLTIEEAAQHPVHEVGAETHRLAAHGVPGMLIPAGFEEAYYRYANLPEQLARLFRPVNPARIDEDLLEPLTDQAQNLIRTSFLVDDAVQVFYRALGNAGLANGELHARRPGIQHTQTARVTPPGTAALHAVKRLWAQDWTFEAVLERLDMTGSVALEARPTLLLAGPPGLQDPACASALGVAVALVGPDGLVGLP
ncbi:hypothetical protein DEDE109153_14295 [Deinococcus deserti]|uniref:Uncharacterized protein n=1 Tax=Deinococcus deserti (strain DSM 17065 / CIP 109153 / LMG 22923 / VCD115) TaxID=546414 RepID=C1CYM2_DEIDV|nr:hypothetical protein [Deinococcus deserti]ACO47052.1 hypothetical protein Deide_20360 [Deinococcus deserti VCD115]